MFCHKCGKESVQGDIFCRFCGQALSSRAESKVEVPWKRVQGKWTRPIRVFWALVATFAFVAIMVGYFQTLSDEPKADSSTSQQPGITYTRPPPLKTETATTVSGKVVTFTRQSPVDFPNAGDKIVIAPLGADLDTVYLARSEKDFDEWFFSEEDENSLAERMVKAGRFLKLGPQAVKASVIKCGPPRGLCKVRMDEGMHTGQTAFVSRPYIGVKPKWAEANELPSALKPRTSEKETAARPIYSARISILNESGSVRFTGTTNLPDSESILVSLEGTGYTAQSKVIVRNGRFTTEQFSNRGKALSPGTYTLHLNVYNPKSKLMVEAKTRINPHEPKTVDITFKATDLDR